MINFYYIAPSILLILCLFSLWSFEHKVAGVIVIVAQSISFLIDGKVSILYNEGILYGGLGVIILSASVSYAYLWFYDRDKHKILLKMGLVSLLFTVIHFFYVTGYIVDKNVFSGFVYHQYQNIQFILYLYMISLFGWSGIMGIYREVYKLFNFNKPRETIISSYGDCSDNSSTNGIMGKQDKIRFKIKRTTKKNRTRNKGFEG